MSHQLETQHLVAKRYSVQLFHPQARRDRALELQISSMTQAKSIDPSHPRAQLFHALVLLLVGHMNKWLPLPVLQPPAHPSLLNEDIDDTISQSRQNNGTRALGISGVLQKQNLREQPS
jgi:hypothetical protein